MLTISPWHGVTSVVMGNCGFGVAPTRPADRDLVLRTLESVEGMSLEALRAGIGTDWPFESFAEFLAAIERRGTAINVGALVGHTPVRLYVMGEEATEREATDEEIGQMRGLVRDALRAGALGFATSKSPTHVGWAGRPVPSRVASWHEIEGLAGRPGRPTTALRGPRVPPGAARADRRGPDRRALPGHHDHRAPARPVGRRPPPGRRRGGARRAPRRPGTRPLAGCGSRDALSHADPQHRPGDRRRAARASRHHDRPFRRRRAREPAVRRLRAHRAARHLGARTGRARARGGGAPSHHPAGGGLRHHRPRPPGARARRRRDGLRPGDGRLLAAAAGARLPGGCRPAGLGRARHPRRRRERGRDPRGRARRRRPRGTAPRPRAATRTRVMSYPIISADSHVTEPPNAYMLAEHTGALTAEQRRAILCENVAELYRID